MRDTKAFNHIKDQSGLYPGMIVFDRENQKYYRWNGAIAGFVEHALLVLTPLVPGAPTEVEATAGNGRATVTFTTPDSNGGRDITLYTVTSSPGSITATGTGTEIVVGGLTNGVTYTFTVRATNSVGLGAPSNASNAVTPVGVVTIPDAPTSVVGTAGNGQVSVAFSPPGFNGGAPISSYRATSSPGGFTATNSASPILVTGLTNGTAYTFTVTATNIEGASAPSNPSAAVTPSASVTVPGAPTIGTATSTGSTTATVAFTAPVSDGGAAITGYRVTPYIGATAQTAQNIGSTTSPLNVTGLTASTSYTFKVAATNSAGTGADSGASNSITTSAGGATQERFWVASSSSNAATALASASNDLASTRGKTVTFTATDQYIYYAYPTSFGALTAIYYNGDTTFNQLGGYPVTTMTITPTTGANAGTPTSYKVYASEFPQTGTIAIEFV